MQVYALGNFKVATDIWFIDGVIRQNRTKSNGRMLSLCPSETTAWSGGQFKGLTSNIFTCCQERGDRDFCLTPSHYTDISHYTDTSHYTDISHYTDTNPAVWDDAQSGHGTNNHLTRRRTFYLESPGTKSLWINLGTRRRQVCDTEKCSSSTARVISRYISTKSGLL